MTRYCRIDGCTDPCYEDSIFCQLHGMAFKNSNQETVVTTYDHLKINIEQTAKGARVTVTYDRSDHDLTNASAHAVELYKMTIGMLEHEGLKVDEA